jgi:hypothetical protein
MDSQSKKIVNELADLLGLVNEDFYFVGYNESFVRVELPLKAG